MSKPYNESRLAKWQTQYLQTKDEKYLSKIIVLIQKIVYNMIYSKLKRTGKFIDPATIEDMVSYTVSTLLHYYRRDEKFEIKSSFVGYLSQMILFPMYNSKKKMIDKNEVSIFTPIGNSDFSEDKEITLLSQLSLQYSTTFEDEAQKIDIDNLIYLITESFKETFIIISHDYERKNPLLDAMINYYFIYHFIKGKPNNFFINCYKKYSNKIRLDFEKSKSALRLLIRDGLEVQKNNVSKEETPLKVTKILSEEDKQKLEQERILIEKRKYFDEFKELCANS